VDRCIYRPIAGFGQPSMEAARPWELTAMLTRAFRDGLAGRSCTMCAVAGPAHTACTAAALQIIQRRTALPTHALRTVSQKRSSGISFMVLVAAHEALRDALFGVRKVPSAKCSEWVCRDTGCRLPRSANLRCYLVPRLVG